MAIALVVGVLVIGWLLTSLVRFRAKPGDRRPADAPIPGYQPAERGRVLWIYVMAAAIGAIMLGLAFSTISAVDTVEHAPPGVPAVFVNVTGYQFGWIFDYTGQGGVPIRQVTPSDVQGLYAPVDTPVVFNVTSRDVWHNFAMPNFRIRVDAIPGQINHIWFNATQVGDDHTVCVMLCGANHALMRANMHILTQADFAQWLADNSTKQYQKLPKQNVTIQNGQPLLESNAPKPVASKPFAFNVTNSDASPHVVSTQWGSVRLDPQQSAYLYTLAGPNGEVTVPQVS
jgi:cytochrome c oxidase subunit 2